MTSRLGRAAVAAVGLACSIACGREPEEAPASPAAAAAPAATEPLFKPVDPNAVPAPPGSVSPSMAPPTTPPAANNGEPMAMVTDMASGWPVNLRVGQSMNARLASDRPAGGRWSLRTGSAGSVLSLDGEPAFEAAAGASGVEVFRLKATQAGQATITFDYTQGSSREPIRSVSYPVTVQ